MKFLLTTLYQLNSKISMNWNRENKQQ